MVDTANERKPRFFLGFSFTICNKVDLSRLEEKMEPELAENIHELDRCIEYGCCIAGCDTVRMREDFVGAAG